MAEAIITFEKNDDVKEPEKDSIEEPGTEDKDEKNTKYTLLNEQYEALVTQYNNLQTQYEELVNFKKNVENQQKEDLINSFYMLSEEDKKDVRENKNIYSLDDIKAKLSIICVDKKVNFDLDTTSKKEDADAPSITYNLSEPSTSDPAWISAVKLMQNKRMN